MREKWNPFFQKNDGIVINLNKVKPLRFEDTLSMDVSFSEEQSRAIEAEIKSAEFIVKELQEETLRGLEFYLTAVEVFEKNENAFIFFLGKELHPLMELYGLKIMNNSIKARSVCLSIGDIDENRLSRIVKGLRHKRQRAQAGAKKVRLSPEEEMELEVIDRLTAFDNFKIIQTREERLDIAGVIRIIDAAKFPQGRSFLSRRKYNIDSLSLNQLREVEGGIRFPWTHYFEWGIGSAVKKIPVYTNRDIFLADRFANFSDVSIDDDEQRLRAVFYDIYLKQIHKRLENEIRN